MQPCLDGLSIEEGAPARLPHHSRYHKYQAVQAVPTASMRDLEETWSYMYSVYGDDRESWIDS
jgi:hypothetical protein